MKTLRNQLTKRPSQLNKKIMEVFVEPIRSLQTQHPEIHLQLSITKRKEIIEKQNILTIINSKLNLRQTLKTWSKKYMRSCKEQKTSQGIDFEAINNISHI